MLKQFISIFFITLFMASTTSPSIILLIDDSIDVSFFYDLSEEEEEKGNKKNKEFEIIITSIPSFCGDYFASENKENLAYHFKNYPKPHLNLIYPPPEYIT